MRLGADSDADLDVDTSPLGNPYHFTGRRLDTINAGVFPAGDWSSTGNSQPIDMVTQSQFVVTDAGGPPGLFQGG